MATLSIVIPSLGDGDLVRRRVSELAGIPGVEIVVVEGRDPGYLGSVRGAARDVVTLTSEPGRAAQMNLGASESSGEVLLFLHADCRLAAEGARALMALPDRYVGGCFRQRNRIPWATDRRLGRALAERAWGFSPRRTYWICSRIALALVRVAELRIDYRTRVRKRVFGDQGIFARRAVFAELGGYREELPLFEDLEFYGRLRTRGRVKVLPHVVLSEPRRWIEIGFWNYGLLSLRATRLYHAGVEPRVIARWFARRYAMHLRRSGLPQPGAGSES